MSKALSLKLKDSIFAEVEEMCAEAHVPRNTYLNLAIDFYNRHSKRRLLKKQLQRESALVRRDSANVMREFDALEDDILE